MGIVILESDQCKDRWSYIRVIGPSRAVYSSLVNTGTNHTNPSGSDLVLNIAMVPGKALVAAGGDERTRGWGCAESGCCCPRNIAARREEPIWVSKWCEGRCAEWIGGDHV